MIALNNHIALCIFDRITCISSGYSVLKALYGLFTIHICLGSHAVYLFSAFAAVHLSDDEFLRYVNHSSGKVSGIGCTKSRI